MKGKPILLFIASAMLFGCKKLVDTPKEACFIPNIDFVVHHVDPTSLEVTFDPKVTPNGTIRSERWDFGDSTSFNGPIPPPHKYNPPGNGTRTYKVKYTVSNDCGEAYWTKEVTVGACLPDVKFSYVLLNDSTVQFTNQTTATGNVQYLWTFGDGTTSTAATPTVSKTYAQSQTYTVTLKATNGCGENFFSTNVAISICRKPEAAQTVTQSGCSDVAINASASKNASRYQWNFGNGVILPAGTASTINYTYPSPGTYTITLTVTNAAGCDSAKTTSKVTIGGNALTPNNTFSYQPDDLSFTFSREAVIGATAYQWNFGDGVTATGMNPGAHTYAAPGTYTLTLGATGACGAYSFNAPITVPYYKQIPNLPATGFQDILAFSTATIYYLGTNGKLYKSDTTGFWSPAINLPSGLSFNSDTRLYRDLNANLWIFGKGEVARYNVSSQSWTSFFRAAGWSGTTTIVAMAVDGNGNLWTSDSKQVRKDNDVVSSGNSTQYTSMAYAAGSGRVWITAANKETLYYGTSGSGQLGTVTVSAMSGGADEIKVHPNGDLYFTTSNGMLRTNSSGVLTGQFTSSTTGGLLSAAPTRYTFDERGNVWAILQGKLLKIPVASAGASKNYSFSTDLQGLNAVDLLKVSSSDNDILVTKPTGNVTAIRIR